MFKGFLKRGMYEELASCWPEGLPLRPGGLELTERALSFCSFPPGAGLLDIGCGTATTVEYLAAHGFHAFGLDPSSAMLERGLKRNSALPVALATGEDLPFRGGLWDGILAECVLSVARDAARVLRECNRVLKDGGRLLVCDLFLKDPPMPVTEGRFLSGCGNQFFGWSGTLCVRVGEAGSDILGSAKTRCDDFKVFRGFDEIPPKEEIIAILLSSGFEVVLWEDHSAALKRFLAQLILSTDIPEFQCGGMVISGDDKPRFGNSRCLVGGERLGYFMLIAQKAPETGRHGSILIRRRQASGKSM